MIYNETPFTPEIQRETNGNIEKGSKISFITGLALLVLYIVLGVAFDPKEPWWLQVTLYVGAVLFGFGLVFYLNVKKVNRMGNAQGITRTEYEFWEEYFILRNFRGEEKTAEMKVWYRELIKVRETPNYLLLFPLPNVGHPVDKRRMSGEDASVILTRAKAGVLQRNRELKNNNILR